MVSIGDCRARGEADWELAQALAAQGHYGWATTLGFYAALHHLNALMVRGNAYSDDMDHPSRQAWLGRKHPAMETRYANMMGKAIRTRYEVNFVASEGYWEYQMRAFHDVRDYVTRVLADQVPGV